jgi:hypothetical protein
MVLGIVNVGKIGPYDIFGKVATQILGISANCKRSPCDMKTNQTDQVILFYQNQRGEVGMKIFNED